MVLPEIVAVGVYNSQVVAKNSVISKNRKTSMFEIELPMEVGGISYIESASKPIEPNMIICAKPGQLRHTKFPYKCYFVHIIIHDGPLYDTLMEIPDFFTTSKREKYVEIFTRMIKHYSLGTQKEEIILQSLLLEMIYTISRDSVSKTKNGGVGNCDSIVEKSLKYIKSHITEDLSLETVSKAMNVSPVYFHNLFKRSVGKTLRDYVEELRIKNAINLLLTTDDSLTKIAFECGFSSQSYFSYVFKRRMKVPPREYIRDVHSKYEI